MQQMLPAQEAQALVLSKVKALWEEEVELAEALGRVLAGELKVREPLPPFRRSAMDGYAVRASDTWHQTLVALKVIDELRAGLVSKQKVDSGSCILLMTGAPLPDEADAVIRREEVERIGNLAIVPGDITVGTNVDPEGSDVAAGSTLMASGTIIGPGEIALLAAQGYARVKVHHKPRVAILTTGDELVDISAPLSPGKIRNSNCYMLAAAVQEAGGEPIICPVIPDELEETKKCLLQAGTTADLVLSSGGVSMGDFDLVRKALLEIADDQLFWKLRIKPGMPVVAVMRQGVLYLGLSGKPNGALLNFYLLAMPVIKKLSGKANCMFLEVKAKLTNEFRKSSPGRNRYLWAEATYDGEWKVVYTPGGELGSLKGYNALIEVPVDSGPLPEGQMVRTILLHRVVQG